MGVPAAGVTLLIDRRALPANCGTGDDADRAFIDPRNRNQAVVGRPPIAGAPVHFFLRDKFGNAPADRIAGPLRYLPFRTADRLYEEVAAAHERHETAFGADNAIQFAVRRIGQPLHLAIQRSKIKVAIDRHQDALAIRRPVIAGDSGAPSDGAVAFALHLFRFG